MPTLSCPNSCETALPEVKFSKCSPNIVLSEIVRIFIGKQSTQPFNNWKDASEWTQRLSETANTANAIRPLTVIADKPAGSPVVKEISNGRKYNLRKDFTVNIEIDDVSPENYEFMRVTQCGGEYKLWFETAGGRIYGGNEGIDASLVLDNVLGRGKDEIEKITGTASWSDKFSPEMALSPIF